MKHLKMLGLAVMAIAALGAIMGAGTASATEACSTNTSPCTGTMYPAGTTVKAQLKSGTKAVLTGVLPVECTVSTATGATSNTGGSGETLKIPLTSLTFTSCGGANVTVTKVPSLEVHTDPLESVTSTGNGVVTSGTFTVHIVVGLITCNYEGTISTGLTIKGGNPAFLEATNVAIPGQKGNNETFCGKGGVWNAVYEITEPKPLFII